MPTVMWPREPHARAPGRRGSKKRGLKRAFMAEVVYTSDGDAEKEEEVGLLINCCKRCTVL